jgi:hypothetical protein
MIGRRFLSSGRRLALVVGTSLVLSVGGIIYAVWFGTAADGGRGGGLTVALAFLILFLGRGGAEAALDVVLPAEEEEPSQPDTRTDEQKQIATLTKQQGALEFEVTTLRNALSASLDGSGREKLWLTCASVFGTLVWTFGDVVARHLEAPIE